MSEKICRYAMVMAAFLAVVLPAGPAVQIRAAELGHYAPALPAIRDFILPDPGVYYIQYNLYYTSDTLKDKNGDSVDSISVGPLKYKVETDVESFMIVPTAVYSSGYKILGGRYAALLSQPFGNTSFQAALESDTLPGFGLDVDESSWGLGDTYIRPLWLGWSLGRFDLGASYGIYLPTGKWDAGDDDNVGLGMWTHEFMANVAYYPDEQKGTALTLAGVYEIHHKKDGVDITPGSHLSLNAGISQYLPMGPEWLAELGLSGVAQWQVTKDSGSEARNKDVKDRVYMVGPQVGFAYLPWGAQLTLRWLHEFGAKDRFEGDFVSLNLALTF
jgi:hypothetical protein